MAASSGYTDLHLAIINNELARTKQLLQRSEIDRDVRTIHDETPLFLSLKNNCAEEMVLTLIDGGCNVNMANKKGVTPLHLAVQRENGEIILKLLEAGADVTAKDKQHNCTALQRVMMRGRLGSFRRTLQLFGEEHLQKMRDSNDITSLFFSLQRNCNDKIVNFLIDSGEDVNAANYLGVTPLHLAVKKGRTDIIRKLLQHGVDVNSPSRPDNRTPLHDAVIEGNLENVCLLLYYDASVNEEDNYQRTPFHVALRDGNDSVAMALIEYVTEFDSADLEGFTAFHYAVQKCPSVAVEILKRGGDANFPWHQTHSSILCIWWHECSDVFEAVWPRIDYEMFSEITHAEDFLETFVSYCKFPNEQFLKCLRMILSSPHVGDFFNYFSHQDRRQTIFTMLMKRDMPQADRVNLIWTLLSYGEEVCFNDVCFLYEKYGFEGCVESILHSGCHISRGVSEPLVDPMVGKILYDSLKIYEHLPKYDLFSNAWHLKNYSKFYTIDFQWTDDLPVTREEFLICCDGGVQSLVQICRDVVRKVIYETQRSACSFKVYDALCRLPVPAVVKDILYLRKAIY